MNTIDELYTRLEDKFFQDTDTGALFCNVYVFQYPATDEYQIREQIGQLQQRLRRPNNNLDILTMNVFEEFQAFLLQKRFGKYDSMLQYLLEKEEKGASIQDTLIRNASSEDFFAWIDAAIQKHFENRNELKKTFVFLYGFGQIYPYLRTNTFLSNFEKYNKYESCKLIVFYPGHASGNSFELFDVLEDNHTYRSIQLINI
jgi:hypothetical protein